jgi:ABC-type phosphate transport system auxiliary subunit
MKKYCWLGVVLVLLLAVGLALGGEKEELQLKIQLNESYTQNVDMEIQLLQTRFQLLQTRKQDLASEKVKFSEELNKFNPKPVNK